MSSKAPNSTYEWLTQSPLISSAGTTVYSWYESSKNYCRFSQLVLGAAESSAQYLAGVAARAPLVKHLDVPLRAVDGLVLKVLETAEQKMPVLKEKSDQVMQVASVKSKHVVQGAKDAVTTRVGSSVQLTSSVLFKSKQALYNQFNNGKEAVCKVNISINIAITIRDITTAANDKYRPCVSHLREAFQYYSKMTNLKEIPQWVGWIVVAYATDAWAQAVTVFQAIHDRYKHKSTWRPVPPNSITIFSTSHIVLADEHVDTGSDDSTLSQLSIRDSPPLVASCQEVHGSHANNAMVTVTGVLYPFSTAIAS